MAPVLGIIVGGFILALAAVLVRFNLKRVRIARAAAAATEEQLEVIYRLIEDRQGERPAGCVLARTNTVAAEKGGVVLLPDGLADFPWSGRVVTVAGDREVTIRFSSDAHRETRLAGKVLRPVRVPRTRLKSGKLRNLFSPKRYLSGTPELTRALREVCPAHPGELLCYLLCVGQESFEFEPIDQARIGTVPAWVQDAEWPTCPQCRRRMSVILQIPGTLLWPKPSPRGTFYWFGCKRHPERTETVAQFT